MPKDEDILQLVSFTDLYVVFVCVSAMIHDRIFCLLLGLWFCGAPRTEVLLTTGHIMILI